MELNVPGWRHPVHRRLVTTAPRVRLRPPVLITLLFPFDIGMRGIYPSNNTLAPVALPRIRQAYQNMATLAKLAGADLNACVQLVVYTTDMFRYRPMCNQVQVELWGNDVNKYPPRTIIEVGRLNDNDIVEVEGTFHVPHKD